MGTRRIFRPCAIGLLAVGGLWAPATAAGALALALAYALRRIAGPRWEPFLEHRAPASHGAAVLALAAIALAAAHAVPGMALVACALAVAALSLSESCARLCPEGVELVEGVTGSVRRFRWLELRTFRLDERTYGGATPEGRTFRVALPAAAPHAGTAPEDALAAALEEHVWRPWSAALDAGHLLDLGHLRLAPDRVECWTASGFKGMPLERVRRMVLQPDAVYFYVSRSGQPGECIATLMSGVRFPDLAVRALRIVLDRQPHRVAIEVGPLAGLLSKRQDG